VTLGNQTIGTTLVATTATALGATFDTTVKSTVNPTSTPGNGQTFTLTTGVDASGVITGSAGTVNIDGNDIINATDSTYTTNDVINGGGGTDVLNLTLAASNGQTATVVGVETINANANMFSLPTFNAAGVIASGTTINVNNTQVGGWTSFTLSNVGSGATVVAGSGITGTLTVGAAATASTTVNAGSAAIAAVTGGTTGSTTVTGGTLLAAIDAEGATINVTTTAAATSGNHIRLYGTSGTSDVATVSFGAAATVTPTTNAIETINIGTSTAGTSASVATVTGLAATTYRFTGSNSIVLKGDESMFDGKTVTDSTTAGTTTVDISAVAGGTTTDLTKVAPDVVRISNTVASTYTVKNNQAVNLTADVGASTFDSTELTTGNETLNLTLVSATQTGALNLSDFELVNLTVNDGAATTGTNTITTLTGSTATGSSIVVSGPDNLTVTSGATSFLNASALAGVLTATVHANQLKITGGTASDTINAIDANFTVDGGSGSADTLAFAASADLSNNTVSIANIDVLQIDAATEGADTVNLLSSVVTGNNWVVKGTISAAPANNDVLQVTLDTTSVSLSNLVVDTTSATVTITNTNVNALSQNIIGSNGIDTLTSVGVGNITLAGGAGADVITTAAGADSISGDAGNDVIITGAGIDTVNGGAGDDTITSDGRAETQTITVAGTATGGDIVVGGVTITVTNLDANTAVATAIGVTNSAAILAANPSIDKMVVSGAVVTIFYKSSYGDVAAISAANSTNTTTGFTVNTTTSGAGAGSSNDSIVAGEGADSVYGGAGADIISLAESVVSIDRVIQTAVGDSGTFALGSTTTNSVSTTGFDVVTGFAAGDVLALAQYTGTAASPAANYVLVNSIAAKASTVATSSGPTLADNTVTTIRGTYDSSAATFVGSSTGADLLVAYDANQVASATAYEAIILVGNGGLTASVTAGTGGLLAFA
jgi:hypothetical protein